MRLIESLKRKKFILFNIFFTLYIGINLIGGEREAVEYLEEKLGISGLPLVDWVPHKESSSFFDLIFSESDISNLGKNFLSNSGIRLYSILF